MKKIAFVCFVVCCLSFASRAQTHLNIAINANACIPDIGIVFTSGATTMVTAGCTGSYDYSFDNLVVAYITINNVACYPRHTTVVQLKDSDPVTVRQITTADGPRYQIN